MPGGVRDGGDARSGGRFTGIKAALEMFQSAATLIALLVGAAWGMHLYVEQREAKPQLDIDHRVSTLALTPDYRLVALTVVHENRGRRLVTLEGADIRLQRVRPVPEAILQDLRQQRSPVRPGESAIRWPLLCRRLADTPLELEPNETQESVHEFVVPAYVEVLRVYTYYANPDKQDIGWSRVSLHPVDAGEDENAQALAARGRAPHLCARDR